MKNWKEDLSDFYKEEERKKQDKKEEIEKKRSEVKNFYSSKVIPAFRELKTELEKHGREVFFYSYEDHAAIVVAFKGKQEFSYIMRVERHSGDRPLPSPYISWKKGGLNYGKRSPMKPENQIYSFPIYDISKDDIIEHFLKQYKSCLSGKK